MSRATRKAAVAIVAVALVATGAVQGTSIAAGAPGTQASDIAIWAETIDHATRVNLNFEPNLSGDKNYTFRLRMASGAYVPGTYTTSGTDETATIKPPGAGSYQAVYLSDGVTWNSGEFRIEKNPVPVRFKVTGCARGVLSWGGVGFDAFTASGDTLSKYGKGRLWLTPGMKVKFLLACPNTQIASYVVVKYKGAGARITESEAARATAAALTWKVREATVSVKVTNLGKVKVKGTEGGTYLLKAARAYTPRAYKAYSYLRIPASAKGRVSPPIE